MARSEPDRLEFLEEPEPGEHLQGRWMGGRGAGAVIDLALGLEQRDAHAAPGASERRDDPYGASADDPDPRLHRGCEL
jgi:hypothetical protein